MGAIIGHLLLAVLEIVAELVFLLTGKWLLLLISGGRLVLMPADAPRCWYPPFKRLPSGQVGAEREIAMLIALLFWISVLAVYLSFR